MGSVRLAPIAGFQTILSRGSTRGLAVFHGLGCALMLGVSRKSFIARASDGEPADRRLGGSLAAAAWGLARGVHIVRVHDVAETVQAVRILAAIAGQANESPPKN